MLIYIYLFLKHRCYCSGTFREPILSAWGKVKGKFGLGDLSRRSRTAIPVILLAHTERWGSVALMLHPKANTMRNGTVGLRFALIS